MNSPGSPWRASTKMITANVRERAFIVQYIADVYLVNSYLLLKYCKTYRVKKKKILVSMILHAVLA